MVSEVFLNFENKIDKIKSDRVRVEVHKKSTDLQKRLWTDNYSYINCLWVISYLGPQGPHSFPID